MNMLLWVLQVLLALAFFAHGNGEQRYPVQAGLSATTFESASAKDRFTRIVRGLSASIPCSTPAATDIG
jgi:hypothetical protein